MISLSLLAVIGTVMLLALATTPALAWSDAIQGARNLTPDCPEGYYLWRDEGGIHLRTHGPGAEHLFTAHLHTDGVFTDVDTVRLESRDSFAVLDGGHTLVLRFRTFNATDGLNFRIRGGTRLRLNLQLDGELVSTGSIYLGAHGRHPESNPFTVRL